MVFFSICSYAQEHQCFSEFHLENNEELNKDYQKKIKRILQNKNENKSSDNLGIITIPIVVHIIHNTPAQNISDAQVQSQIDVLNRAFDLEAPWISSFYPQASDVDIQFVLANVDPNGNTTTGITRTSTSVAIFSIDPSQALDVNDNKNMKLDSGGGKNAWPTDEYLNIWVINCQYYIKGFGTFPNSIAPNLDGIVMNYKYFGNIESGATYQNYAQGKSCVHEIGHWLDLRHLFANNDCAINDGLSDTPAQENYYFSCSAPITECGNAIMLENYMQYTYDQCQMVYTNDQKTVMRNNFLPGGARESFLTSRGYQGNQGLSTILGNIFHDNDEDEEMDNNESLYSNVKINLYNCNDQLVNSTVSNSEGYYQFADIEDGQYYVLLEENSLPAGKTVAPIWLSPSGCSNIFGGNNFILNFALLNYGSISGSVWEDMNGDGIMQGNEPSISNVTVYLKEENGSVINQINPSSNGQFSFTKVYPEEFYLEFALNNDYLTTIEGNGIAPIDNEVANYNGSNTTNMKRLEQSAQIQDIGAGFFRMAEVSGTIWEDDNWNGIIDNNEDGIGGVTVKVYNEQLQLVQTRNTETDGTFSFNELYPNNYFFKIIPPNGTAIIPQTNHEYYFDQSNGPNTSPMFQIASGNRLTNLNAGLGLGTVALEDVRLSGETKEDHLLLNWSTESDSDLLEFELQKKNDEDWITIYKSSDFHLTEYKDFERNKQTSYYRLLLRNINGQDLTSNVVALDPFNLDQQIWFQNPIQDKLYINLNNEFSTQLKLKIYSNQTCIDQLNIYGSDLNANNQISIDFDQYPAGMYILQYELGTLTGSKKLIKVN